MDAGAEVAGRYRLEELVGSGPMSEVWRAHDDTLDRTVALKILAPTADLERFRREARAVASLAHEHVMRVYDYGEDEVGPFMALEWLPGGTLEERLHGGALPSEAAARHRHRDRVGARASARARIRPSRPQAGERPLRRGGSREARRLRARPERRRARARSPRREPCSEPRRTSRRSKPPASPRLRRATSTRSASCSSGC